MKKKKISDIEMIKLKLNIVDIIKEHVKLEKKGKSYKGKCPFHNDEITSFVVNEDKQYYHCFGCNQGGDIVSFLMEIEKINFTEAFQKLAYKAGFEVIVRGNKYRLKKINK